MIAFKLNVVVVVVVVDVVAKHYLNTSKTLMSYKLTVVVVAVDVVVVKVSIAAQHYFV